MFTTSTNSNQMAFQNSLFRKLNIPQNAMSRHEIELANKSKRALQDMDSQADPIEKLRLLCLSRGATGILILGRMFRRMHEDRNKRFNEEDFTKALQDTGMEISDEEAKKIFETCDIDGDGNINMDQFLINIRPPMSDFRKEIVEECFKKLDKNGDGKLTLHHLKKIYNVKFHPKYLAGEEDEETILRRFLANFDDDETMDGIVTKEEFLNYYAGISAAIDNDCYFALTMRHTYKL